ncbi:hypothetical protein D3C80_591670 [compost metagenome]
MASDTASDTSARRLTARMWPWPRERMTPIRSASVSTGEALSTGEATASASSLARRRISWRGASGALQKRSASSARTAVSMASLRSDSTAP